MCCDGSLFQRVGLPRAERVPAHRRLALLSHTEAFEQPCTALVPAPGGVTCSIYEERPHACRRFDCKLLARHRDEGGPLAPRVEAVKRVRSLLALLRAAEFDPAAGGPQELVDAFAELSERLERDFARAASD
jgi:Fe-S-cluster containining protein